MSAEDALIVFTPSGRRGRFPLGTTVLQAARASASTSIRSAAAGPCAGAARSRSWKVTSPSTA